MQTSAFASKSYRASFMFWGLLGTGLAANGGCVYGEMRQVVRAQFASELSCPDARADKRKPYDEGYVEGQLQVKGCGVIRIYTCPADTGLVSYDDKSCTFEEVNTHVNSGAPAPAPAADEPMDDMMDAPAEEPAPEPAPEKKSKSGKAIPKPSGKFKASASTEPEAGADAEAEAEGSLSTDDL